MNLQPWRNALAQRPRDTRDTLFLLAVIGWTVAPHLLRLPLPISLLALAVLGWRARLAWREAPLPGRKSLLGVVALAAGLTWINERTLMGKEAGVTLLVLLMALKTLELRARRDALVVFFLGFFLVLTQFFYSQSLLTALAMGLSVWGWLAALTLAHMPAGRPALREAGLLALRAAAFGTPLMVALFLLFPRIAPLWGVPGETTGRTGLADSMHAGDVAELAQDDSVAMRVRFDGAPPAAATLYFRGPVLSQYDGKTWRADPLPPYFANHTPRWEPRGSSLGYELTVEPLRVQWLPLLEYTGERPEMTPSFEGLVPPLDDAMEWRLRAPLGERVRLHAVAWPDLPRSAGQRLLNGSGLTALPAGAHPRTQAWARALRQRPELQGADAQRLAQAVLQHLRDDGYIYTLSPGPYDNDSVDEFWLERKLGFCEHYASAFVVVMRALGIPARVVTGYQGSDPLPVDGYYVIRQSHAHAWAEYWQAGVGWLRADPTAAVAPERVQQGRPLQSPRGMVMGTLNAMDPAMLRRWREFFEAVDNRWNQWVLGYGRQQQYRLLDQFGGDGNDRWALARWLVIGLSGLGLAGAAWAWWDGRRQTPWQRLHSRLARQLSRLGVPAPPQLSPGALAERVRQHCGPAGEPVAQALMHLQILRYAPPPKGQAPLSTSAWWREFRQAVAATRSAMNQPRPLPSHTVPPPGERLHQ
jgi:transglutaminase-like putative cysteine protease